MADDKKKTFPKIAPSNWFLLRDKFKQRIPAEVSASYVATALGMAEESAGSNVISPLKALGLVQEDGKPTELAYEWRDDEKYKEVCEAIIHNVYPQELRDLFHERDIPLDKLTSWFMRSAKVGEPAARMFARTYQLLLDGDPSRVPEVSAPKAKEAVARRSKSAANDTKKKDEKFSTNERRQPKNDDRTLGLTPNLHIDIQVHIAPESSAELIDKIFESMARHLGGLRP